MLRRDRFRIAALVAAVVLAGTILAATLPAVALAAGNALWTEQFGTDEHDVAYGTAVYGAEVYVAGATGGAFPGKTNEGLDDTFVSKYNKDATFLWNRQLGGPGIDQTRAVAVAKSGVYVAGYTTDALPGKTSKGGQDAFVLRYAHDGDLLWSRQFGTANLDFASGIGVDSTGVYVAGVTHGAFPGETNAGPPDGPTTGDGFVRKYGFQGNVIWTDQFGSAANDAVRALDADSKVGVYVVGYTSGSLPGKTNQGGQDAFAREYDSEGDHIWTRQFGSSDDELANGVAADSTGVYVAGQTRGALPSQTSAGESDAFVRRYGLDGTAKWTRQFGTEVNDEALGVALDAPRGLQQRDPPLVYVVGGTSGTLPGEVSKGGLDAYARAYKKSGTPYWTEQFGTPEADEAKAASGVGSVAYVAGWTDGLFPLLNKDQGGKDAFVRKYD